MSSDVARHSSPRSVITWFPILVLGGLIGIAGFAWSSHLSTDGQLVAARVILDGNEMGGLSPEEVSAEVSSHADQVLAEKIAVQFVGGSVWISPGEAGFHYDRQETVDAVVNRRRTGGAFSQFASWATTPLRVSEAQVSWRFDADEARAALADITLLTAVPAVEPEILTNDRGQLSIVPGQIGKTVDLDYLVARLDEIDLLNPPERISVKLIDLPPRVSDITAEDAAARWSQITNQGLRVDVGESEVRLSAENLRAHLILTVSDGQVTADFDTEGMQRRLELFFGEPVIPARNPVFEVIDDDVRVVKLGRPAQVCCAEGSSELVADLILSGEAEPFVVIVLEPRALEDPEVIAWANGSLIVEQVSSFTTPHQCCQTRVENIQRMADMVDGVYLLPGETFSLNDFVGPRTVENGFAAAGAIRRGHLVQEIGGGVSQFATTIFNAAYFAGLDFDEYRSHTIYFSRYPYGREATISTPGPDLALSNTTDYPILIHTSYTGTSITVSIYSTANVEVEELEQRVGRQGACTHVETDRQRTYSDGRVVIDTIEATYRPEEGIDCNGNPIPPPEA